MMIKGLGKRQEPREGDYYNEEGILICGKCGRAREWKGFFPGVGTTFAPCVCYCDMKHDIEDKKAKEIAEKKKLATTRRNWAFPSGSELAEIRFEKDDKKNPEASKAVCAYARSIAKNIAEGNNLILFGGVGTGKSFFAAAVLNHAIDAGYRCLFTSFPEVVNELSSTFDKNGVINNIKEYDLVVFDDFGIERNTGMVNEQIYQVVNARYLSRKPMIITTNMDRNELNPDDIRKKRILSRLLERAVVVPVAGADRRTAKYRR